MTGEEEPYSTKGNHDRTHLFLLLKVGASGWELLQSFQAAKFPGDLRNFVTLQRRMQRAAASQPASQNAPKLPEIPESGAFKFFDWSGSEMRPSTGIAEVPTPGIVFAVFGEPPPDTPREYLVLHAKQQLEKIDSVREFLASPEARMPPSRYVTHDIFISYASADLALATELRDNLNAAGREAFLAEHNIGVSTRWEPELRDALRESRMVVMLVTPNSVASPWVIFEAGAAWALEIPIAPATLFINPRDLPAAVPEYQAKPFETQAQRAAFVQGLLRALDAPR